MRYTVREATRNRITNSNFSPSILPNGYQKYFSVGYENGNWILDVGSFVGMVPCIDGTVIQIEPKVPTRSITYILIKSGYLNHSLETPFSSTVPYQISEDSIEGFFEALVGSFLIQLDEIRAKGLIKTTHLETNLGISSGKINVPCYVREYTKRFGLDVPRDVFISTGKNIFNQVLFDCLTYLMNVPLLKISQAEIVGRMRYFSHVIGQPTSEKTRQIVQSTLERNRILPSRMYYLTALNLALLILSNIGVDLSEEADVYFRPILLPTDKVFEAYIRNILRTAFALQGIMVVDGRDRPITFFEEAFTNITMGPDILLYKGGRIVGVADVKYKSTPTAADYYQMWSYLEGTGANIGSFIHVGEPRNSEITNTAKRGDRTIYSYQFQLDDLERSERQLIEFISRDIITLE